MSEVLGQVMTFGIIALLLITGLLAFGPVQERAERRVARIEAQGAAQQVASAVVEASLLAETGAIAADLQVPLRGDIAGRPYTVTLEEETVLVEVNGLRVAERASLLGTRGVDVDPNPANFESHCFGQTLPGGTLRVVLGTMPGPAAGPLRPASCVNDHLIHLQEAHP